MQINRQIEQAAAFLSSKGMDRAETGIVLGTGLHQLTGLIEVILSVPYPEIPHSPVSTVEFHKGNLICGMLENKKLLLMQGRFHAYEGYAFPEIVFLVRVMKSLGIKHLLLSNAAGGINLGFKKGDLAVITDHLDLQSGNALAGRDENGFRSPAGRAFYSRELSDRLFGEAAKLGIPLKAGVYAAVNGPNLETRAEYRYLKIIGADLVGMSTVPEVIAANQLGLPCAAVSVITDECDPDHLQPVDIREIIAVAGKADKALSRLFYETIRSL